MKTMPLIFNSRRLPKPLCNIALAIAGLLLWQPSMHAADIVRISSEVRDVMNLETVEVVPARIPRSLSLVGRVEPIPEKHFFVSGRVAGRVTELLVVEGQSVRAEEVLVEVETLLPGNPPPKLALRAPFAGIVTKVSVTKGQGVEAGQTLIEMANLDEVFARAEVFESLVGEIPTAAKARISAEAYPEEYFTGALERFGGQVNPANGALPSWFRLGNPNNLLRPGMLTDLRVIISEVNATMTIPVSALLGNAASPFVYVSRDKEGLLFRRALVELGAKGKDRVEILKGLMPGNRVVSTNAYLLGMSVGGDVPSNSHGHDHGGHAGHGHAHGGHGQGEGNGFQLNTYVLWWLAGGLGLSVLLNLFLVLRRRGSRTQMRKSS